MAWPPLTVQSRWAGLRRMVQPGRGLAPGAGGRTPGRKLRRSAAAATPRASQHPPTSTHPLARSLTTPPVQFKSSLERELAAAEADRDAFVALFGQEGYEEASGWERRWAACGVPAMQPASVLHHLRRSAPRSRRPLPPSHPCVTASWPLPPPQVLANWRGKLERVEAGEQRWGLFRAFKPAAGRDFHAPEPAGDGVAALA